MKKILPLILAVALTLSLAACGGEIGDSPNTTTGNGENNQTSGVLKIGDTSTAGDWEFTLTGIEFSDAVADENNGLYYLRPADDEYKSETGHFRIQFCSIQRLFHFCGKCRISKTHHCRTDQQQTDCYDPACFMVVFQFYSQRPTPPLNISDFLDPLRSFP